MRAAQTAHRGRGVNNAHGRVDAGQVLGHYLDPAAEAPAFGSYVPCVVVAALIRQTLVIRCPVIEDKVPPVLGQTQREAGAD